MTLRLRERRLVERIGHRDDTVSAIGRGDDDAQTASDVEGHRSRRIALDRVDESRRREPRLGGIDRCADLGIGCQRHERRVGGTREDVGELGLSEKAETHDRRRERFPGGAFRERFLDLLLGHDATAEEELDDAAAFGLERTQLLSSSDGRRARAQRTE